MNYRLTRSKDISNLILLDIEIFEPDFRHDFEATVNWMLKADGEPVGFACAKILDNEYMYFERAGISEDHRGLGLHNRLIKNRIAYARKLGLKGAVTYTSVENPGSGNNLIDHGFRMYTPEYPWVGSEFIYYLLEF